MSRNIKEIGKELMGKSLNSFHRKTGLTQLEKNNEMQDGILDGILSQVDDTYIEKTEQSNVIHLDGSGDGVVVLDSIEGNTMVNHINSQSLRNWTYSHNTYTGQYANTQEFGIDWSKEVQFNCWLQARNNSNPIFYTLKPNTDYTVWINILENNPTLDGVPVTNVVGALQLWINGYQSVRKDLPINTTGWVSFNYRWIREDNSINYSIFGLSISGTNSDGTKTINGGKLRISKEVIVLEGVDKPLNSYFEGLQSSFEEQVEDNKYKIEILSKTSKNLYDLKTVNQDWLGGTMDVIINPNDLNYHSCEPFDISHLRGKTIYAGMFREGILRNNGINFVVIFDENKTRIGERFNITSNGYLVPSNAKYMRLMQYCGGNSKLWIDKDKYVVKLEPFTNGEKLVEHKSNKIKLLINEPLRAVDNAKDRLCVKDGKLTIERNTFLQVLNGQEIWNMSDSLNTSNTTRYYTNTLKIPMILNSSGISDKIPYITGGGKDNMTCIYVHSTVNRIDIRKLNTDNRWTTLEELKTWLRNNNVTLVLKRLEPVYEEVTNEYGEPILLEGYENGTIYIDSTIVPTTTVRYTPKMESFKTLKEVENNNIILTNDVNDNIIPYMMDVDLMIMEKEMALMSHKNIRKMEVLDMTSMQKRTQDMLERLIKGKSLTEQECKTRVTTYLNAGKITDEQAEELMLLIDEVYA